MSTTNKTHVVHPFEPCFDQNSRILILGSFPSVKSREMGFYYGHPQNRFWKVMEALGGCVIEASVEARREFLLQHHIACFDVIRECDILGSSDASIENAQCTDISMILQNSKITKILTNGKTSHRLYRKMMYAITGIEDVCMPSTSSANAAVSLEKLIEVYLMQIEEELL